MIRDNDILSTEVVVAKLKMVISVILLMGIVKLFIISIVAWCIMVL